MAERLILDAQPRILLIADAVTFALAAVILLVLFLLRMVLSPLAFVLLVAAAAAWQGLDVALWLRRGVRSIELGENLLTVYSGRNLEPRRIDRRAIAGLRVVRRLGRSTAVLRLKSGSTFRLHDAAFLRESFERLLTALQEWSAVR